MALVALAASLAVDAVAAALLGWVTLHAVRERERPNAWPFAALSGGLLLWAALSLGSELSSLLPISGVFVLGQVLPIVFVPGIWTVYVLGYIGRGTGLTRLRVAMFVALALPLVGSVLAFAGDPSVEALERTIAPLIGTELMLLFVLYSYAAFVFLRYGWSHARISRRQLAVQLGAVSAPYVIGVWRDGHHVVDGVTGGLLVSGGLLALAVKRYPVLTGFPKADYVARSRVVEALQEAVIVLDWEGRVLDANATAERLFDRPVEQMIGAPVGEVADGIAGADLSPGETGAATLQTIRGRRQFQFTVSAVEEDGGVDGDETDPVARALLLRDVTDQRTREQRLAVLNRVLRHNVRNKFDVILAHADHVENERHRTAIQESATELVSISRKARDAEAVMTDSVGPPEPVDLAAVARAVANEYRDEFPESELSVRTPDRLRISSHRAVVRQLLAELVENAIVHTTDRPPRVEIEARTTPGGATELVVRDNGPGIPDRERQILAGEAETQLEHGLGIGLWFVNWAVLQLGGDLSFADNDPEGTVTTVRFPVTGARGTADGDGSEGGAA